MLYFEYCNSGLSFRLTLRRNTQPSKHVISSHHKKCRLINNHHPHIVMIPDGFSDSIGNPTLLLLPPSLPYVIVDVTQPAIGYCCHYPACHGKLLLSPSLSWVTAVVKQPVMGYCCGHPACHGLLLSPSLSWVTAVTKPVMGYCCHPAYYELTAVVIQPVMGYCCCHPTCHGLLLSPSLTWVTVITHPVMG